MPVLATSVWTAPPVWISLNWMLTIAHAWQALRGSTVRLVSTKRNLTATQISIWCKLFTSLFQNIEIVSLFYAFQKNKIHHWNQESIKLTTISSLVAPAVLTKTTCGATIDDKVAKFFVFSLTLVIIATFCHLDEVPQDQVEIPYLSDAMRGNGDILPQKMQWNTYKIWYQCIEANLTAYNRFL